MKPLFLTLLLSTSLLDNPCVQRLQPGYLFLKSYEVETKSAEEYYELSYVFTNGTNYNLSLCPDDSYKKLEIYNFQRKKMIETTDANVLQSALVFPCSQTGIYYIRIYSGRGSAVLSFKRA